MIYVAVVGPGDASDEERGIASAVGGLLARAGAVVVTGGLGGVMEAASRGAREAGGLVLGIVPGDRQEANAWCTLVVATGMGEARNAIVVRTADAVIAVGGGYGTLSEIALALRSGKPVCGIGTWPLDAPVLRAASAAEAVEIALRARR